MYYSDNKYLQCYSLVDDLAFQNMMLKQSFNQNVTYMDSLLFNYTFNANSFLQMIIRLPGQSQKFKDQTEKSIIEAPLQVERLFKNSLNQVNQKNQQICQQLLILQKHLEKKAQKNKSLQKNLAKELQLKQEVTDFTDKSFELILKIQEVFRFEIFSLKIELNMILKYIPVEEQKILKQNQQIYQRLQRMTMRNKVESFKNVLKRLNSLKKVQNEQIQGAIFYKYNYFQLQMALVNITNIIFESNIALFQTPVCLQITFEVLTDLSDEIDWKLIYVGSPQNEQFDQILDSFSMGPLQRGAMQFTITSQPPNYTLIPSKEDLFGISALILTASYRQKEFFRVGYYVYNYYSEPELIENEPPQVLIDKVYRQIMAQNPRITKFPIDWEGPLESLYVPPTNQQFMFQNQNVPSSYMPPVQQAQQDNHMNNIF